MLLFGHAGITLGAAVLAARVVNNREAEQSPDKSWFTMLSHNIDIRLLIIGSLLPDIIDKPIGQYFFRETFNNGRIFTHTLVFLVLVTVIGIYIYKSQRSLWMLTLATGVFTHLALDEMWQVPQTFFWPFLGFTFPKAELTGWASNIFQALLSNPYYYVTEVIGLLIVIWLAVVVISRKKISVFIRYGKIR